MLKDEKFANSNDSDIKFEHNYWTELSKKYNSIEKFDHYFEFLYYFVSTFKHYMERPENKKTAATHLIEELLTKYGMTKVITEVENEFKSFEETVENLKNKE